MSAAGAALGGAVGGSFAGLGAMALGKAAGAVIGSAIDQRLLGAGSAPVETGRVERFRVMGSSEGAALAAGVRADAGGGASDLVEPVSGARQLRAGRRQGRRRATVREYSYSVSLAIALCEGEVSRIGRIWADGQPIEQAGLTLRLHPGPRTSCPTR